MGREHQRWQALRITMVTILYVSGVREWHPEQEFADMFSFGGKRVVDVYVSDKGFAFVYMANARDARRCLGPGATPGQLCKPRFPPFACVEEANLMVRIATSEDLQLEARCSRGQDYQYARKLRSYIKEL